MPRRACGPREDVVPQPRLAVALQLGQVEIRARAMLERSLARCGRSTGRSRTARLRSVAPSTTRWRSTRCQPRGRTTSVATWSSQPVLLALGRIEGKLVADSIDQRRLAGDHVGPGGREGVLEIGHEHLGAAVECVDGHLWLGWSGDLHAPVVQVSRRRCDGPIRLADARGLRQEVEPVARGQPGGPSRPAPRGFLPARLEFAGQRTQELERRWRQHTLITGRGSGRQADIRHRLRSCPTSAYEVRRSRVRRRTLPPAPRAAAVVCPLVCAESTHQVIDLRYDGALRVPEIQASALNLESRGVGLGQVGGPGLVGQSPGAGSRRASNAPRPAGCMRPDAINESSPGRCSRWLQLLPGAPWREARRGAQIVDPGGLAIDPAEAQRLDDRLVIGDAPAARHPSCRSRSTETPCRAVVDLQPGPEVGRRIEEANVLRLHQPPASRSRRWSTRAATTRR